MCGSFAFFDKRAPRMAVLLGRPSRSQSALSWMQSTLAKAFNSSARFGTTQAQISFYGLLVLLRTELDKRRTSASMSRRKVGNDGRAVERLFRRIKGFRRVCTRYEKADVMFMAFGHFVFTVI
jgi:transposase